jgi:hypothetical protein
MIKILNKLALFLVKNANFFADFFGENIYEIIKSVPVFAFFHFFDFSGHSVRRIGVRAKQGPVYRRTLS